MGDRGLSGGVCGVVAVVGDAIVGSEFVLLVVDRAVLLAFVFWLLGQPLLSWDFLFLSRVRRVVAGVGS